MASNNKSNYCKQICISMDDSDNLALSNLDISEQAPNDIEKEFFVGKSIMAIDDASKLDKISKNNNCECK